MKKRREDFARLDESQKSIETILSDGDDDFVDIDNEEDDELREAIRLSKLAYKKEARSRKEFEQASNR